MSPLIQCQYVNFGYDNQDAVIDVNMEMDPGDYLCVVGKNDSGKGTLTKRLSGLIKPADGKLVTAEGLKRIGIGYPPQQTATQRGFPATVPEVVLSGCLNRRGMLPFYFKKEEEIADRDMEEPGTTSFRRQCYRELSDGQQQRVLIAKALCTTSSLLILDKPTTGLDPTATQEFCAMIRRLSREDKMAIPMVSHDLRNAAEEVNEILHLQRRVLFYGPAHDYMNSQAVGHFSHEKEQGRCRPTVRYHAAKLHMHEEEKSRTQYVKRFPIHFW